MLKLYFTELKKLKRQKTIRLIAGISLIVPGISLLICIRDKLPYQALVAQLIWLGNFLVAPCLFCVLLLMLFQLEEQNGTLKNILVTNTEKWKIFLVKIIVAFTAVFVFVTVTWLYSLAAGIFLPRFGNTEKALIALYVTAIASIAAFMPVLFIIIMLRKKYLISMVLTNCVILINFILVWMLTMMQGRNLHVPVLIAYRITLPIQGIDYWSNKTAAPPGVAMLYYPLERGICILAVTFVVSLLLSIFLYKKQEI